MDSCQLTQSRVLQGHPDGAPQGQAVAHTREDDRPVPLDEHPAAPAVAPLPPGQVGADVVFVQGESRRDALDDDDQPLPVGLSRRQEPDNGTPRWLSIPMDMSQGPL